MDVDNTDGSIDTKPPKKTLKEVTDNYLNGTAWFALALTEFIAKVEKLESRIDELEGRKRVRSD